MSAKKRRNAPRRRHKERCSVCGMTRRADKLAVICLTPQMYGGPRKLACKAKRGRECENLVRAMVVLG